MVLSFFSFFLSPSLDVGMADADGAKSECRMCYPNPCSRLGAVCTPHNEELKHGAHVPRGRALACYLLKRRLPVDRLFSILCRDWNQRILRQKGSMLLQMLTFGGAPACNY